ncbi:hypothetical protein CDD83_9580 [Cordyceps sp. RAO-2017]|nr:hypothetical protein CDD83_9580 [Cordyceps sp. RAO-2017]
MHRGIPRPSQLGSGFGVPRRKIFHHRIHSCQAQTVSRKACARTYFTRAVPPSSAVCRRPLTSKPKVRRPRSVPPPDVTRSSRAWSPRNQTGRRKEGKKGWHRYYSSDGGAHEAIYDINDSGVATMVERQIRASRRPGRRQRVHVQPAAGEADAAGVGAAGVGRRALLPLPAVGRTEGGDGGVGPAGRAGRGAGQHHADGHRVGQLDHRVALQGAVLGARPAL